MAATQPKSEAVASMLASVDKSMSDTLFAIGQWVVKQGEDSRFEGEIVACFVKRNRKTVRYVVENDEGVLHIASEKQLQPRATSK
jgi:hypothetical protein